MPALPPGSGREDPAGVSRLVAGAPRTSTSDGDPTLPVVSEVGYFLSPRAVDRLADRVAASLDEDGVVVLCHWRHPVEGWPLDGAAVHERVARRLGVPLQATYADRDVEIRVHAPDAAWPDPGR